MKRINTCDTTAYSQLIPAMKAICHATPEEKIEIVMSQPDAFQDLKEYLAECKIGFREIYGDEQMTLQFVISDGLVEK